jgi:hypothetical protein
MEPSFCLPGTSAGLLCAVFKAPVAGADKKGEGKPGDPTAQASAAPTAAVTVGGEGEKGEGDIAGSNRRSGRIRSPGASLWQGTLQRISLWWTYRGLSGNGSPMARSKYRDTRDTHHTVSAGVLESLGKGFLIATASVVAGMMFGTAHLAAMGLWMIGVAAVSGVSCMIGSALVRNAGCDSCEKKAGGSPRVARAGKGMAATPVVEAAGDVASEERWARRMAMINREREHGTGVGRGA